MARYIAIIRRVKKRCPHCEGQDLGDYNRIDCGCLWEEIVGEYDRLNVAAMVAARMARRPGTKDGGVCTKDWLVLDRELNEEIVAHNL
jgi:hypothetical protein